MFFCSCTLVVHTFLLHGMQQNLVFNFSRDVNTSQEDFSTNSVKLEMDVYSQAGWVRIPSPNGGAGLASLFAIAQLFLRSMKACKMPNKEAPPTIVKRPPSISNYKQLSFSRS